ncbi:glycerophosphoryl diester phosphodiesterase membrane domain-containing protein, partial [Clostridioides difficile]
MILNIIYMIFLLIIYISVIRWIFSIHEITLNTENFKSSSFSTNPYCIRTIDYCWRKFNAYYRTYKSSYDSYSRNINKF